MVNDGDGGESIGRLITNNGQMHLKIATFNCNGAIGSKTSVKNIARVTELSNM